MNSATYSGSAVLHNRTDDRELKRKTYMGTKEVDFPKGNGLASATATRGYKSWFSTREAGLTVESTVSVHVTCGQSQVEISSATEQAGILANQLAIAGLADMGFLLTQLPVDVTDGLRKQLKEGGADKNPDPPRRSEKGMGRYGHMPRKTP